MTVLEKTYLLTQLLDAYPNFQFKIASKDFFILHLWNDAPRLQKRYIQSCQSYRLDGNDAKQMNEEYWGHFWIELDTLLAWIIFERDSNTLEALSNTIFQSFTILQLQNQEFEYLSPPLTKRLNFIIAKSNEYLKFLKIVLARLNRQINIENFEQTIEDFHQGDDTNPYERGLMERYTFWFGYVYFHEHQYERQQKCRFWFEKSVLLASNSVSRIIVVWNMEYQIHIANADKLLEMEKRISLAKEHIANHPDKHKSYWIDAPNRMWIQFLMAKLHYLDALNEKRQVQNEILSFATRRFEVACLNSDIHCALELAFLLIYVMEQIGYHLVLYATKNNELESRLLEFTNLIRTIDEKLVAINIPLSAYLATYQLWQLQRNHCNSFINRQANEPAREQVKENLTASKEWGLGIRKSNDKAKRIANYAPILMLQVYYETKKTKNPLPLERVNEAIKWCLKRMNDEGWDIFLTIITLIAQAGQTDDPIYYKSYKKYSNKKNTLGFHSFGYINISYLQIPLLKIEFGTSIIEFFELIAQFHVWANEYYEFIGISDWQEYQKQFLLLHSLAQCHLRTHYRYHNLSLDLWRINALVHHDIQMYQIADKISQEMRSPLNPMQSILDARWTDFKNVPENIRNTILNRAISITKGDILAASEMSTLSYRNLRHYVASGEVNRLGNFNTEFTTHAKILETGLRLLLSDDSVGKLSFDTLFDLPAYLIGLDGKAFTTKEMANHLNLATNTAHKHISRLLELGIIKPFDHKIAVTNKNPKPDSLHKSTIDRQNHYTLHIEKLQERYLIHKEELESLQSL